MIVVVVEHDGGCVSVFINIYIAPNPNIASAQSSSILFVFVEPHVPVVGVDTHLLQGLSKLDGPRISYLAEGASSDTLPTSCRLLALSSMCLFPHVRLPPVSALFEQESVPLRKFESIALLSGFIASFFL